MNKGTITNIMTVASKMHPTKRINKFISRRKIIGLISAPANKADKVCGIFSLTTTYVNIMEAPITNATEADDRALSTNN